MTPAVKTLIIANVAVHLIQRLFTDYLRPELGLIALEVLPWSFQIWRPFTYMFLHNDLVHLFWNMFLLFMFGSEVERQWGARSFYRYYFLCGLGGALFAFIPFLGLLGVNIIGASGAAYGVLLAFGLLFPFRQILLFFVLPIQARYLVMAIGLVALVYSFGGPEGIAHAVHLGGFVTGYVLIRAVGVKPATRRASQLGMVGSVKEAYRKWRMKRLRRKFEQYYENRNKDRGGNGMVH